MGPPTLTERVQNFMIKNDLEAVKFEQKKLREILMASQHELSEECLDNLQRDLSAGCYVAQKLN